MPRGIALKKSDVSDALKEFQGIISFAADKLGVYRQSLSEFISNDNELSKLRDTLRHTLVEKRKDIAEHNLDKFMNKMKEHPRLCYSATTYVLENTGKDRGYGKAAEESKAPPQDAIIDTQNENMELKAQLAKIMKDFETLKAKIDNQSKAGSELS